MYSLYFISKNKHNFYIVYNIMGKKNTFNLKKYILPFNILIIIGLFVAYQYYDKKLNKLNEYDVIEGVRNTNCCGGIEGGVITDIYACTVIAVLHLIFSGVLGAGGLLHSLKFEGDLGDATGRPKKFDFKCCYRKTKGFLTYE